MKKRIRIIIRPVIYKVEKVIDSIKNKYDALKKY